MTLKMPSVVITKTAVMPSAARRRVSRVAMRSKFSSVNVVTASVRSMSVNARTRSTTTGATKKQAAAGPAPAPGTARSWRAAGGSALWRSRAWPFPCRIGEEA